MWRGAFDGGTFHEASDDFCFGSDRSIGRHDRDRDAMVSFDQAVRWNRCYATLHELHIAAGVNKLPIEDFEDMSLVYSTVTAPAK